MFSQIFCKGNKNKMENFYILGTIYFQDTVMNFADTYAFNCLWVCVLCEYMHIYIYIHNA